MTRLLLVLVCGITVPGCASLGLGLELPEASTRFQEAALADGIATAPAPLPALPVAAGTEVIDGVAYTLFTDPAMDDLMRFVDVADANQQIGELNAEQLRQHERRINALIGMGQETERQAALYREGWIAEYEAHFWETWTLRVGLGIAIVGLIVK